MRAPLTLEQVERAYDSPPWWYDVRGFFILCVAYQSTVWAQIRFFSANMGPKHLEAAIGTATLFELILRWRKWRHLPTVHTVGFDYAEPMLAGARQRLLGRDEVELLRADIAQLQFADETFDSANIANAIHCLPDVETGLKELARVLKPRGTLALNALLTPRRSPLRWVAKRIEAWGIQKGILHTVFEEPAVLAHLARAGFTVEHSHRTGNTLNVVARKEQ